MPAIRREGPLQGGDIQLLHLQHGLGRPLYRCLTLGHQYLQSTTRRSGHSDLLRLQCPAFPQQ